MAEKIFGVIFYDNAETVDIEATEIKRKKIRANRKQKGKIWEEAK